MPATLIVLLSLPSSRRSQLLGLLGDLPVRICPVNNAEDGIDPIRRSRFPVVFVDQMPIDKLVLDLIRHCRVQAGESVVLLPSEGVSAPATDQAFNELHEIGVSAVLAGDRSPAELASQLRRCVQCSQEKYEIEKPRPTNGYLRTF